MSKTTDLLNNYGRVKTAFNGISWVSYILGKGRVSYIKGSDRLANKSREALVKNLEREILLTCNSIEESKR